ncbi:gasdermin-D isoform X4 [Dipodomys spectabilis]|uniref:gasdermin-D isoform X4 n=1 Tax=Dipodomys spectabilis TaxID=105255 RepID=UPI001C53D44D|nr:gasdermin-D isoform X4 [Dipodomys spectabilis]
MPSTFERVVQGVVRELDHSRKLIPVDSLHSSTGFRPYCLVSQKPSRSWFWKPRYTSVNLSIKDILEPDAPEPDLERDGPFHFSDDVDGELKGNVELAAPGQGKISGGAAVSGSSSTSINVCTLRVDPNIWEAMHQERRLRQPEHKILKQLRSRRDNLYVVTEVLQTQEEVQVTRTHKKEGSGQFILSAAMCLQGEGQGHLSQKNTVSIPAESILAFRVAQLVITHDWDERKTTFPPPSTDPSWLGPVCSRQCQSSVPTDGCPEDWVVTEDLQGLQAEVEAVSEELQHMEAELKRQLLGPLGAVLRDEPALQALEASLDQGLCCGGQVEPLEGPAGAILEYLVLPSRVLAQELATPIFYLLGALMVLSESQHQLLAEALETDTLPEQLRLVEQVLEQSAPWHMPGVVSLPPDLLGRGWGEEAPAWALLEECGLALQVPAPQVRWEPQAQGRACALYASLALLSRLSPKPC